MNFYRCLIQLIFVATFSWGQLLAKDSELPREPILETTELAVIYSDQGVVVAQVEAAKRLQYENGDVIFPEGIYGIFYDKNKQISGTLSANQAYQYVDKEIYELIGDVEIKSYQDQQKRQLNTEELHWNLNNKEISTDTFVRVEGEEELLTGYGLFAKQDLSYYTIARPEGFVHIESITASTEAPTAQQEPTEATEQKEPLPNTGLVSAD